MEAAIPYLAGPASAVFVLVGVLVGLYRLCVIYGVPMVAKLANRHLDQFDKLLATQREEQRQTQEALQKITQALQMIDSRLTRIERTDAGVAQ